MKSPLTIRQINTYYHYLFNKDHIFEGHRHNTWEVNVVLKGTLEITYDDSIITLGTDMLMIFEPEVFHKNRVLSTDGAELLVFMFLTDDIPQHNTSRVYTLEERYKSLITLLMEEAEKSSVMIDNVSRISKEFNYQTEKLLELLLIKFISEKENIVNHAKNPEEIIHHKAINFMKEHIHEKICIEDIAKYCNVSPTKLKNNVRNYTGQGVMEYFSDMKINAAKKLLRQGKSSREISDILGYSSQAYFSICFKKSTGISPIKYKFKEQSGINFYK